MTVKVVEDGRETCFDYWAAGRLSVCFVYWRGSRVEEPLEFYSVLRRSMPKGTEMFGGKLFADAVFSETVDYCVVLGFPYRVGSWNGLMEGLVLRSADGSVGPEVVGVLYPVCHSAQPDRDVDKFVVDSHKVCSEDCDGDPFGFPLTVKIEKNVEVPFVKDVRDMWMAM